MSTVASQRPPRLLFALDGPGRQIGGKAAGLARAARAGLPVPEALVIGVSAYREMVERAGGPWSISSRDPLPDLTLARRALARTPLPEGLQAALAQALRGWGPLDRFSVRSSASVEDTPSSSAAGIFESVVATPRRGLPRAVRRVWASVWTEAAYVYLRDRGVSLADVGMAVLLHGFVEGLAGAIFTRDPSSAASPELRIELGGPSPRSIRLSRHARSKAPFEARLLEAARRLERASGGRPLDIEFVRSRAGKLVILQQRPITAFAPMVFHARPPDGSAWKWDAEHNPEPLSPAQQSLVALVAKGPGVRQIVLEGYLYATHEKARPARRTVAPRELARHYAERMAPAMEAILAPLEQLAAPTLRAATRAYRAVYEIYAGELAASLRLARGKLATELVRQGQAPTLASSLIAGTANETSERSQLLWSGDIRTFVARFGAFAPVWDVASPTYEEAPPALPARRGPSPEARRVAAERRACALEARIVRSLPPQARRRFTDALAAARSAYSIGEADDLFFARAQRLVRRALLARGPDPDIFFVPLGAPLRRTIAAENRRRHERQRTRCPPMTFVNREPRYPTLAMGSPILSGVGTGGRVRGRIGEGDGMVRLTPTLLPQESHRLAGAIALVTDHGTLLSHGATQARERGIAAVLGTQRATRELEPGDEVLVDGERGLVYRLTRRLRSGSRRR